MKTINPLNLRGRTAPVLPEAGASGTPLMVVIAILAFMASIALSAYFMVSHASKAWTGDLKGTVTIQVKGVDRTDIEAQAKAAMTVLELTEGIEKISRMARAETEALLEPWLGKNNLSDDVPIPALISADVTPNLRQNLDDVRQALIAAAPGATLDDHGMWNDRLISAARRSQAVAFVVFAMVMIAAGAVIIFATRAGLAANHEIVEVMHLVGATDKYIAGEIQSRYLSLGIRGGVIGALFSAVVLFVSASFEREDQGFFLPNLGADPSMLLWLIFVPVILCAIAAIAARFTVLDVLHEK